MTHMYFPNIDFFHKCVNLCNFCVLVQKDKHEMYLRTLLKSLRDQRFMKSSQSLSFGLCLEICRNIVNIYSIIEY